MEAALLLLGLATLSQLWMALLKHLRWFGRRSRLAPAPSKPAAGDLARRPEPIEPSALDSLPDEAIAIIMKQAACGR